MQVLLYLCQIISLEKYVHMEYTTEGRNIGANMTGDNSEWGS